MSEDELKYKKLRDSLRTLPRIKARSNFESRLFGKIKDQERLHSVPEKGRGKSIADFIVNLLRPSLAPAIGLTVVLLVSVVIYFAYFNQLNKGNRQPLESVTGEKKGEFVIYVHKDVERVYDESARDITSAEIERPGSMNSPTETSSDAFSRPDETRGIDSEMRTRDDRISDEQKLEMEKESIPKTESDEMKTMPKKEDGVIMKKSGESDDSKEGPFNIRRESEDTGSKDNGMIKEQKNEEQNEINQQTEGKGQDEVKQRISRSKKDSLKAKEKKLEEQKDSIEK